MSRVTELRANIVSPTRSALVSLRIGEGREPPLRGAQAEAKAFGRVVPSDPESLDLASGSPELHPGSPPGGVMEAKPGKQERAWVCADRGHGSGGPPGVGDMVAEGQAQAILFSKPPAVLQFLPPEVGVLHESTSGCPALILGHPGVTLSRVHPAPTPLQSVYVPPPTPWTQVI